VSGNTLDDIEQIKDLKARYFRLLDTKDWNGWRNVFTHDFTGKSDRAVSTLGRDGKTTAPITGPDPWVADVRGFIDSCITVHHGHMPEIKLTSPTTASGIWSMEDIVEWPDGKLLRGYGHYHETYRKVNGEWRIATMHLTRIRLDLSGPWPADGIIGH
jgi:hypothetical protein